MRTAGRPAAHSSRSGPISPLLAPLVATLIFGVLCVAVAGLAVLGTVRPAEAGTNTVVVTATGLAPARLAMPVGSELVVRNDSDQPVQVTASTANWTYARLLPAGTSSEPYRFDAPGEYGYDVTFRPLTATAHPPLQGQVVVGAAASPTAPSTAAVPPASTPLPSSAPPQPPGSAPSQPAPTTAPPASPSASVSPTPTSADSAGASADPAGASADPAATDNASGSSTGSPTTAGRGTTSLTGGLGGVPSGGFTLTDPPPLVATPPPVVAEDPAVQPLSAVRPGSGPIRPGPLPGAPSSRGRGLGLLVAGTLVLGVGSGLVRVLLAVPPRR